jgi:V/A-type H+-transporting ATPase subunit F
MKKIAFITSADARYGFNLAGVPQHIAEAATAEETLVKTMADPGNGLIVIDERLLRDLPGERLRELERGWKGILLALPSPEKLPAGSEDYAARLIRRAIGYHVRLKL